MRRLLALGALVLLALPVPGQAQEVGVAWVWSAPHGGDRDGLLAFLEQAGAPHRLYANLGMVSFLGPASLADASLRFGGRVDAAGVAELHLDRSVAYIGADDVKRSVGPARDGPSVLVVDTGVDTLHPDFQDGNLAANVQAARTGGLVIGTLEQVPVVDLAGHGTHVAGIVAGSGDALGTGDPLHGKYAGVYSVGRVVSYQASTLGDDEEDIGVDILAALEAFDWAIANRARFDIRVVSNSWGDPGAFDPENPVNQASLQLYLDGMVVVFSAGNDGEDGPGSLNTYCQAPWVLCVAAGDLEGRRLSFSSYGHAGSSAPPYEHPDLTAPGLFIHAAKPVADASLLGAANRLVGGSGASEELYEDRSGTSMAAPHVAAAAALLQAGNPALSPDQVMDILVATTRLMSDGVERAGAGYLDAGAAYGLAETATGTRTAFLRGDLVKYAGPAVGDGDYRRDPVTVGFDGEGGRVLRPLAGAGEAWLLTPTAWILLGAAILLLAAGTRWAGRGAGAARAGGAGATADGRATFVRVGRARP